MYPNANDFAGPSLPPWFLWPATVTFLVLALYLIGKTRGRAARFLIFACWFRYTLSSLHEYTYQEIIPGLSLIAAGSLLSICLGIIVLDKRRFFARPFMPVFLICILMVISATLNDTPTAAIEPILRFLFFTTVAVALWQAVEASGALVLKRLLVLFAQPVVYQIASILLGIPKSGELDGSISFIGGYYHEELFSMILATCFVVAVLAPGIGRFTRLALSIVSFVAIYLANYRTTMLGIAPVAIVALILVVPRAFRPKQQFLVGAIIGVLGAGLMVVGLSLAGNRFSDLSAISEGATLIKPPESFSYAEQRVLSSRPYIWSHYLYAYREAPPLQQLIGFGPDSWEGTFPIYAHNTIVSFLFELGAVGAAAILLLWLTMFRQAMRVEGNARWLLIAGHASFFVLNMATMPHWQIEGNIFYGLLCGYTIAKARCAGALSTPVSLPAFVHSPGPDPQPAAITPRGRTQ